MPNVRGEHPVSEQPEYVAVQFTRHADGKLRQAGDMFWQWQGDVRMLTLEPAADSTSGIAPWLSREEQEMILRAMKALSQAVHDLARSSTPLTEETAIALMQSRLQPWTV